MPKPINPTAFSTLSFFADHLLELFSCFYLAGTPSLRMTVSQILQTHGRSMNKKEIGRSTRESSNLEAIPMMLLRSFSKILVRPIPSDSNALGGVFNTLTSMIVGESDQKFSFLMSIFTDEMASLSTLLNEHVAHKSFSRNSSLLSHLLNSASISYCGYSLLLNSLKSDGEPQYIHVGSRCRGCLMEPIVGVRYRCISRVCFIF